MHNILIPTLHRLLVDIGEKSGCTLCAPDDITDEWVLIGAPSLEKSVLRYLEGDPVLPEFPDWLLPLWERFVLTDDPILLGYLRQVLLFCYKTEYEPNDEQINEAEEAFVSVDDACGLWEENFLTLWDRNLHCSLPSVARGYLSRIIANVPYPDITPAHGPGSVFPNSAPERKSDFWTIYATIQNYYPFDRYFTGLSGYTQDRLVAANDRIREESTIRCSLVAVPKDSRGPRTICVHPKESIWIQQGQRRLLESAITSNRLTSGFINFRDQTINGRLALESSLSREFCTLDMKEASDRISCGLVKFLFGEFAYAWLSCTRATQAVLFSGRVITLRKWAPMGNCLTFPVESLIFWAIVRAGIWYYHGTDCGSIYVFGDDVIFPSQYYGAVVKSLASFGMVPNVAKTFYQGFFRESCGVDAYRGIDVTPVRMKKKTILSYSDALSLCAVAKRLRVRGFEHSSSFIYSRVRKVVGELPLCNNPETQGLYEYVDMRMFELTRWQGIRWNRSLHKWQTRIRRVVQPTIRPTGHDWCHVLDSLVSIGIEPVDTEEWRTLPVVFHGGLEYPVPYRERSTYGYGDLVP